MKIVVHVYVTLKSWKIYCDIYMLILIYISFAFGKYLLKCMYKEWFAYYKWYLKWEITKKYICLKTIKMPVHSTAYFDYCWNQNAK